MRTHATTLVKQIEKSVIGSGQPFQTCFGQKPLIYADYTASGRSLTMIEATIRRHVLPWYANTHTETSFTGAQSTKLREEARQIIRQAVNASEDDKIIFCGSGATTGINKMIDILGIRLPKKLDREYQISAQIPKQQRPVVFIGPYEHHSNELPWRESIAQVVTIPLNEQGQIDLDVLQKQLKRFANRPLKIGSFSAASNVTGTLTDVSAITTLLKQQGALAFWDYAAAGPYVKIDMNADAPLDAVFISPHKFVGGPGTPGILIAKQHILNNDIPAIVGGGTVMYVTPDDHCFIADHERREEGGTPAIVESVRAGLVFKLQQDVTTDYIQQREHDLVQRAIAFFDTIPEIEVLGNRKAPRLPIFSLRFKHQGQDLHYGFVTALLNDLFGIQVRGGCSCAGPYGHHLLAMDRDYSHKIEAEIQKGVMVLRPGWVRFNFNYFINEAEFHYILHAIARVAQLGWRLLPFYQLDADTAVWRFQGTAMPMATSLFDVSFSVDSNRAIEDLAATANDQPDFDTLLVQGEQILTDDHANWRTFSLNLSPTANALRWFVLPQHCIAPKPPQKDANNDMSEVA